MNHPVPRALGGFLLAIINGNEAKFVEKDSGRPVKPREDAQAEATHAIAS